MKPLLFGMDSVSFMPPFQASSYFEVEEGLCGRTTEFEDEDRPGRNGLSSLSVMLESHYPVDYAILMLGTNDCKSFYGLSSSGIGKGIEKCLDLLEEYLTPDKILLISPMKLGDDVWREDKDPKFNKHSVAVSKELKDTYRTLAKARGIRFMAASDFVSPSPVDSEHMDEVGHRIFADAVYNIISDDSQIA